MGDSMSTVRIALLLLSVALLAGCTTASTYPTRGQQLAQDVRFSSVAVSIDQSLATSRLVMFREYRGAHLLKDTITSQLEAQGRIDLLNQHNEDLSKTTAELSTQVAVLRELGIAGRDAVQAIRSPLRLLGR